MSTKLDMNERRQAIKEILDNIRGGGDDEFDQILHKAAVENVEAAAETGTQIITAIFRTIEHVSRCPNPRLRMLQLGVWARVLEELGAGAHELAAAIKKELKS